MTRFSFMITLLLVLLLMVSGPTFATLVFGFALLWNAQQTTSAQVIDVARGMGRLEGVVAGVERSLGTLNARIERLGESVDRLADRVGPARP